MMINARGEREKERLERQRREERWRYLEKRMYEHVRTKNQLQGSVWDLLGWSLFFYGWLYGTKLLLWPPMVA